MAEIKERDLVTIPTTKYNTASNTYKVYRKIGMECFLHHPLSDECFIVRPVIELNTVQATLQNPVEKCLFFAKKHEDCLSHTIKADLTAICYYFIVRKDFTMKQRSDLASICGKIASVILQNNIKAASEIIMPNTPLLDDFYTTIYNNFQKIVQDPTKLKNKNERFAVFNIAGFVLAQLGEENYE